MKELLNKILEIWIIKAMICLLIKTFYKNTAIVYVDGGIGSQIFKYAFGTFLTVKINRKVFYDLSWYVRDGLSLDKVNKREFVIDKVFPETKIRVAPVWMSFIMKKYFKYENPYPFYFDPEIFTKSPAYYDGYYSNSMFFYSVELELRRVLAFSSIIESENLEFQELIRSAKCPVSVHIRKGDYVNTVLDVLNEKYYLDAIDKMVKVKGECVFFFFTNDYPWLKERVINNLNDDIKYGIFKGNNDTGWIDMYLMYICNSHVISNSSFSWVPAWLNNSNEKLVIIPRNFMVESNEINLKGISDAFNINGAIYL